MQIRFIPLLDQFINEVFRDSREFYPKPPAFLFHYTNEHAFRSMLSNGRVWATSAAHATDKNEIAYGCDLLAEVVKERASAHSLWHFSGLLLSELQLATVARIPKTFIACFCERDDCLSVWRYGPCCLRFPLVNSGPRLKPTIGFHGQIVKAIYSRQQQRELLCRLVDRTIDVLQSGKSVSNDCEGPAVRVMARFVAFTLSEMFMDLIVSFKAPHFEDEREWRLVLRPEQRPFSSDTSDGDRNAECMIKVGPKPYIELEGQGPISNIKLEERGLISTSFFGTGCVPILPIDSVRIGPFAFSRDLRTRMLTYLVERDYEVELLDSEIPVEL